MSLLARLTINCACYFPERLNDSFWKTLWLCGFRLFCSRLLNTWARAEGHQCARSHASLDLGHLVPWKEPTAQFGKNSTCQTDHIHRHLLFLPLGSSIPFDSFDSFASLDYFHRCIIQCLFFHQRHSYFSHSIRKSCNVTYPIRLPKSIYKHRANSYIIFSLG